MDEYLLELGEIGALLQEPANPQAEVLAIRMAQGWLRSATRLASWPSPVPEDLWSWALELAAMAYENPTGLETDTTGDNTLVYARARRREILADAARAYGAPAAGPQGSFPLADVLPWELR